MNGVEVRRFRAVDGGPYGVIGFLVEYAVATVALHIAALRALRRGTDVLHLHNPPDLLFPAAALFRLAGREARLDHHDLTPETVAVKFGSRVLVSLARVCERLTFRLLHARRVHEHVVRGNCRPAWRESCPGT